MSAQFFGRSGKVLYGAFSIVGMAYQSQNVNNGIPDDRVARSNFSLTNIKSYFKHLITKKPNKMIIIPKFCRTSFA